MIIDGKQAAADLRAQLVVEIKQLQQRGLPSTLIHRDLVFP